MVIGTKNLGFQWSDYLVLVVALSVSSLAGIVQGLLDHANKKRNQRKDEGSKKVERNISVWPASLSILASTLAAPFVIGVPTEIYAYGFQFGYLFLGIAISFPFSTHFLVSRFYQLEITSIYEFLEFRFNKLVRSLCSAIFALSLLVYIGIITFVPAVVFSKMTATSMASSVLGVGMLGIFYTTLGGLKGVIWVDAIQMIIVLASVLAIIIRGSTEVGGASVVLERASSSGRLEGPKWSLDPFARHTVWTQALGGGITTMVVFTNQAVVQKFLGLPSLRYVYITSYTSTLICIAYFLLFVGAGMVMYAYYATCSPVLTGSIQRFDELVPAFVLEIFQDYHGIPGLFTAAVFSASLSSMAGGMNALAAVTFLDVMHPIYRRRNNSSNMPQNQALIVFKLLVVMYGLLTIGVAYLAPMLGKGMLQVVMNLLGIVGTPMLAVFLMGIFMPWINSKGAIVGLLSSLLIMFMISFGGMYVTGKYSLHTKALLPLSNSTCPPSNYTNPFTSTFQNISGLVEGPSGIERLLSFSYMWYPVIAMAVAILLGFLTSWITGFRNIEEVNGSLSYMCCYRKYTQMDGHRDELRVKLRDYGMRGTSVRKERCGECRRSWIVEITKL